MKDNQLFTGILWGLLGVLSPAGAQVFLPAANDSPEAILFDEIPSIETATLYAQTLQEAPANVTVITEKEIRRYGYRTLAEALSNVRGFYVTSDGALYYGGVRGFNLPGDYNTRILVMINGHYMTDNVYGAMYLFGQDFGIDMDLIQRIEVVRGPSSALYGTNGLFATVNIFTRAPADSSRAQLSADAGTFGRKKTFLSSSTYLGNGANLLLSASAFHSTGRTISDADLGSTNRIGAEHGYHTLAHLTWRNWSLIANFSDRRVMAPMGWYGTDFGNPGTSSRDAHNFVESSWRRAVGKESSFRWRIYYDQYRYTGRYHYTFDGATSDYVDNARGDWVGTNFSFQTPLPRVGTLTFGTQLDADIRNFQELYALGSDDRSVSESQPNRAYAVFAQQEWKAGDQWTFLAGIRFDDSVTGRPFASPRAAVIYKRSDRSVYKLLFGRAFRNPSTFERYYEPNPALQAERIHTFEFVNERSLGKRLDAVLSVYHYRLAGLIEGVVDSSYTLQYQNVRSSHATGFEAELRSRPVTWLETAAGATVQKSTYTAGGRLPNSPRAVFQFRAAAPLFREKLSLSLAARHLSGRMTPAGQMVRTATLADVTATTSRLHPQFDLQFGVRNLFDRAYADPMSDEHLIGTLPRAGRSFFFRLLWRIAE